MRFNFISPRETAFEDWDWRNPDTKGIGGSEVSHIEMARRLSKRGHEVYSYTPAKHLKGNFQTVDNVHWCDVEDVNFESSGIWVVYRHPPTLEKIPKYENQKTWLVAQDVEYKKPMDSFWTSKSLAKCDRMLTLCEAQAQHTKLFYPELKDKVFLTSNGVRKELVEKILAENIKRNPRKLLYASSPDRGLETLLPIFARAKECVPDLHLAVAYGFDNINKLISAGSLHNKMQKDKIMGIIEENDVEFLGRLNQPDLYRQHASSGIWCHPSIFTETSCCTCMEAQALGSIPITTPIWAIGENVRYGVTIMGNPKYDKLTQAKYVGEIVRMALEVEWQEQIREEMMPYSLQRFDWENFVDQWEEWATEDLGK